MYQLIRTLQVAHGKLTIIGEKLFSGGISGYLGTNIIEPNKWMIASGLATGSAFGEACYESFQANSWHGRLSMEQSIDKTGSHDSSIYNGDGIDPSNYVLSKNLIYTSTNNVFQLTQYRLACAPKLLDTSLNDKIYLLSFYDRDDPSGSYYNTVINTIGTFSKKLGTIANIPPDKDLSVAGYRGNHLEYLGSDFDFYYFIGSNRTLSSNNNYIITRFSKTTFTVDSIYLIEQATSAVSVALRTSVAINKNKNFFRCSVAPTTNEFKIIRGSYDVLDGPQILASQIQMTYAANPFNAKLYGGIGTSTNIQFILLSHTVDNQEYLTIATTKSDDKSLPYTGRYLISICRVSNNSLVEIYKSDLDDLTFDVTSGGTTDSICIYHPSSIRILRISNGSVIEYPAISVPTYSCIAFDRTSDLHVTTTTRQLLTYSKGQNPEYTVKLTALGLHKDSYKSGEVVKFKAECFNQLGQPSQINAEFKVTNGTFTDNSASKLYLIPVTGLTIDVVAATKGAISIKVTGY